MKSFRFPRKMKKQIKQTPVGPYCYGSTIGAEHKIVNGKRQYKRGGCCPFWHSSKKEGFAYCSFLHRHNDFELADQTKLIGCDSLGRHFDNVGTFNRPPRPTETIKPKGWDAEKLEQFLIIHERHRTGLCTMRGTITIEQIPNASQELIVAFNKWVNEAPKCQNNIERLKKHYNTGIGLARHIKSLVGEEILVDYYWINPDEIKKGEKRHWEGMRIDEKGWISFRNCFDRPDWIPASAFDVEKAMREQEEEENGLLEN